MKPHWMELATAIGMGGAPAEVLRDALERLAKKVDANNDNLMALRAWHLRNLAADARTNADITDESALRRFAISEEVPYADQTSWDTTVAPLPPAEPCWIPVGVSVAAGSKSRAAWRPVRKLYNMFETTLDAPAPVLSPLSYGDDKRRLLELLLGRDQASFANPLHRAALDAVYVGGEWIIRQPFSRDEVVVAIDKNSAAWRGKRHRAEHQGAVEEADKAIAALDDLRAWFVADYKERCLAHERDRAAGVDFVRLALIALVDRAYEDTSNTPLTRVACRDLSIGLRRLQARSFEVEAYAVMLGIDLSPAAIEEAKKSARALLDAQVPVELSVRTKAGIKRRQRGGHVFGEVPVTIRVSPAVARALLDDTGPHGGLLVEVDPNRAQRDAREMQDSISQRDQQIGSFTRKLAEMVERAEQTAVAHEARVAQAKAAAKAEIDERDARIAELEAKLAQAESAKSRRNTKQGATP